MLLTFSVQQQSMKIAGWETPLLFSLLPVRRAPGGPRCAALAADATLACSCAAQAMSFVVQCGGSLLIVLPKEGSRISEVKTATYLPSERT